VGLTILFTKRGKIEMYAILDKSAVNEAAGEHINTNGGIMCEH